MAATALGAAAASAATLRVGVQDDPDAMDPATSNTYAARFIFSAMCDKLVDIAPDLKVVPQLATSWEWSPDHKALTFTLRPDVKFQDGTPFDAEAVKFNIERMKTMPESSRKAELASVTSVDVVEPLKVRLNLSQPFAPLLTTLTDRAGMMVSPKAAKDEGSNFSAKPVCAGPYQFVERKARDVVRLKKFPGYWNAKAVGYDEVVYSYIEDSTVRLARLRAGDLDLIERVAPTDLGAVRGDGNVTLHSIGGLAVSHLMINMGAGEKANNPLAKDARLREAFELSLDRNVINKVAFNGEFLADNQMIPPSSPFYSKAHPVPARNIERAKELIAAAGQTRVPVEITYANALTDNRVGQIVQSLASQAGFDVKLLPLESATAIERYLNGNFQVFIGNWSGRSDPDGTLYAFFSCNGSQNVNKYCNKELQQVLDEGRAESDDAARVKIYEKAADIYLNDRPTIPIYHPNWFFAARKTVDGIVMYPDGLLRLTGVKPKG
jgi:peptide/nickel transport system substrate-binding protein